MSRDLAARLAARAVAEAAIPPRIFDPADDADRAALAQLVDDAPDLTVHDTLDEQLRDLVASRHPDRALDRAALDAMTLAHRGGVALVDYGRWIHFPWSRRLVHLLGPSEFHELRSDRNRYKITPSEQAALRRRRIGVVGLSVGQATAVTLALEGVGGRFRLADFDTLALSNLNRLRAGVHGLGVNKAILASREMYEIDPYLDIEIFPAGITEAGLDAFLVDGGGLDLLVEECDDLYVKVRIRERARAFGIAVVMETSDRGMIDVERFDREPARPLFHGLLGDGVQADALRGLATPEKVPYVLRILGDRAMSTAGLASLLEIRTTISTWPQLASGVALGGALVTDTARRILLGQFTESGRYYVDLDELIRDGAARTLPALGPLDVVAPPEALAPWHAPARPASSVGAPTTEELRWLVAHAVLAPSDGNVQPWQFVARASGLDCRIDIARARTFLDHRSRLARVAIGCAVENLVLAARAIGLAAEVTPASESSDPPLVCRVHLRRAESADDPLFDAIARRATHRGPTPPSPLRDDDRAALLAALPPSAHLDLLVDEEPLARVAQLAGATDRVRLLSETMHRELTDEIRWSPDEVLARRDGIDLAALAPSPGAAAALRVRSDWPAMRYLRRFGGGGGLEQAARRTVAASSAIGFVSIDLPHDGDPAGAYFHGGRALERVWLTATTHRLALQPLVNLPFLFTRFADGDDLLATEDVRAVERLRPEFDALFPLPPNRVAILAFRLAYADPPAVRTLRRPVDDVLTL